MATWTGGTSKGRECLAVKAATFSPCGQAAVATEQAARQRTNMTWYQESVFGPCCQGAVTTWTSRTSKGRECHVVKVQPSVHDGQQQLRREQAAWQRTNMTWCQASVFGPCHQAAVATWTSGTSKGRELHAVKRQPSVHAALSSSSCDLDEWHVQGTRMPCCQGAAFSP